MGAISIGFAKIGITLFILEVQGPAYRFGKWFLIGALCLNVCKISEFPRLSISMLGTLTHHEISSFRTSLWSHSFSCNAVHP